MPGQRKTARIGRLLFVSGLSISAICASFSISLTEGGLLLAWVGFVLKLSAPAPRRRMILLDYLVIALLAWALVTALASPHRMTSLRTFRSEWFVVTYFLISFGMESTGQLRRILKLLAVVAAIVAVYGIVQHFTGIDYIKHKQLHTWNNTYKAMGLLGHHITFGVFYAWIFALSLSFLILASGSLRTRIAWTILTCLPALAVLSSYSRAAWIGAAASLVSVTALRRFRVGYPVLIVVAAVVIAVVLEPSAIDRARDSAVGEQASTSDATRVRLLETALRMIKARPVLGSGPGTFTAEFDRFKVPGRYRTTCHPHNDLINYAVSSGLVGLAILVAILVTALRTAVGAYRSASDPTVRLIAVAAGAGLVAILVSGLFQCNLTDSEIGIQAWLAVGSLGLLARIGRSAEAGHAGGEVRQGSG